MGEPELDMLLERFRRGPEVVAAVLTGAAGGELDFRPNAGRWSIRQIVCHLADSEVVAAERIRRIIAEDKPVIQPYDQDAWAERLDYHRRRISQALETFRRMRLENYELLKGIPEELFSKRVTYPGRGTMSLREIVELYTRHAEKHAVQIRDVREAYKASRLSSG